MTKTWYFELSVLLGVFLCMYTLAIDTPAEAPDDDTQVLLRTLTTFIVIFLTLEMALELLITATSWVGVKEYMTNPILKYEIGTKNQAKEGMTNPIAK